MQNCQRLPKVPVAKGSGFKWQLEIYSSCHLNPEPLATSRIKNYFRQNFTEYTKNGIIWNRREKENKWQKNI